MNNTYNLPHRVCIGSMHFMQIISLGAKTSAGDSFKHFSYFPKKTVLTFQLQLQIISLHDMKYKKPFFSVKNKKNYHRCFVF